MIYIFKTSHVKLPPAIPCFADKGYQELQMLHANSQMPKKKPGDTNLTDVVRWYNQDLARLRVVGEHVNRHFKALKILSDRIQKPSQAIWLKTEFDCMSL